VHAEKKGGVGRVKRYKTKGVENGNHHWTGEEKGRRGMKKLPGGSPKKKKKMGVGAGAPNVRGHKTIRKKRVEGR